LQGHRGAPKIPGPGISRGERGAGLRRILLGALTGIASAAVFFFLVEGIFSTLVALSMIFPRDRVAERFHTHFDEVLGWVNTPGVVLPDLYGPGKYLKINSQGFRADQETYAPAPPRGKRLICSGDSFTLGYGVGNPHTWCHLLSARSPVPLETVNMGQGGYGVDQVYLWFERDAAPLAYQIHLFAFVAGDFERMLDDEFSGYAKPVVGIVEGRLSVLNAPLPRPGLLSDLRRSPFKLLAFRSVSALFSFTSSLRERDAALAIRSQQQARIVSRIFEELREIDRSKGAALIAVHLPLQREYRDGHLSPERAFLAGELERLAIPYWDLLPEFQALREGEFSALFIPTDDPITERFPGAGGHYNEAGNAAVAASLMRRLVAAGLL
jgi:hypothetical protein